MTIKIPIGTTVLMLVMLVACTPSARADFSPPEIPQPQIKSDKVYNVKDFGAVGDGKTRDTDAINKAIDKCASEGGGVVQFPPGKYLVASVHLKSNMKLVLDKDAEIIGARDGYDPREPNPYDKYQDTGHSHFHDSVMWGENLENFAIIGGKLNGGGTTQSDKYPQGVNGGNKVVAIRTGKNLLFKDITHETGAHFVYLLNDCENITVDHVVIKKSRDAIDLMGCRNVAVHDCHFTGCSDDTLGIKSDYALGRKIDSHDIYAWDNYFESGCNGLQFGSETAGDFRNIWIWNIKIGQAMKAGIGITSNDGGIIEDVHYKNIQIKKAANPIFLLLTARLRTGEKDAKVGAIKNVTIQDVVCTDVVAGAHHGPAHCATISGRPDGSIENITLDNVQITYKGGEKKEEAQVTPPYPKDYSPRSMGPRPAAGFYIRDAKDITFRNTKIAFESENEKPVLVASDVQGLTLDHVDMEKPSGGAPLVRLDRVTGLKVIDSPGVEESTQQAAK